MQVPCVSDQNYAIMSKVPKHHNSESWHIFFDILLVTKKMNVGKSVKKKVIVPVQAA